MSVRPARADDAAAMHAILAPIVRDTFISFEIDPPSLEEFRERLAAGAARYPWLVFDESGEVLGYAASGPYRPKPAYAPTAETSVYVREDARGRGVGARLCAALLDALRERGYRTAVAAIALPNAASVALHERLGYERRGVLPAIGRKLGAWHDVALYTIDLDRRRGVPPAPQERSAAVMTRFERAFSGAPWERQVGYCRAVRAGNTIAVSGTAPVAPSGGVAAPGDAYGQAKRCIEIAAEALEKLGASLGDVVRTRMFVTDAKRWAEFGRAHAEAFGPHPPVTTMVEVRALIDPAMLIEIEFDAIVSDGTA